MKYDRLYNFISPVTGKLPIDRGYILLGDKDGRSFTSPILIDVRQDIIDLKRKIGNFEELNLPDLGAATFPLPQLSFLPTINIPIPNPTFNPESLSDWIMSGPWLPQILAGSVNSDLSNPKTVISSSLAITQVKAAQIMKRFDNANFIVGSSVINFDWDNPQTAFIPEPLKQLYGLGTSYTFTKAQSLGALETGLLKNTVNNANGTLSKAIPGIDYVDFNEIPIGTLVVRPDPSSKYISSTNFSTRGNTANEFGYPIAGSINILTGVASKFEKLAITSLTEGSLLKIGNNFGEIVAADDVNNKLDKLITFIKLLIGVKDTVDFFSITTDQASNLNKIVKTIGGVKNTVDMVDVTLSDASKLTDAVKNAVGLAKTAEMADTAVKAADVFSNKAALAEMEAQIAALAGVTAISALINIFSLGALAVTGYNYGQYIKGESLNTRNTWYSVDDNDSASNATGELRPLQLTPFKNSDRGHGTLWFDSNDRESGNSNYYSEGGLRIFSWDSSPIGFRNELAPVHIGLFGYRKNYTEADEYKGFIFRSEFSDDTSSDNYRFPIKFGLYDVYKKIHSYVSGYKYGWNNKQTIFEYDYKSFNFYKPVKFLDKTAIKIPVGNTSERPSIAEVGMLRYNIEI